MHKCYLLGDFQLYDADFWTSGPTLPLKTVNCTCWDDLCPLEHAHDLSIKLDIFFPKGKLRDYKEICGIWTFFPLEGICNTVDFWVLFCGSWGFWQLDKTSLKQRLKGEFMKGRLRCPTDTQSSQRVRGSAKRFVIIIE